MPQYVIHIGPPKTGTKYLQISLRRLRQDLAQDGIDYPDDWWTNPKQFSHDELLVGLKKGPNGPLERIFDRLNATGDRTILLSCEGLIGLSSGQAEYLKRLTGNSPVRIVYYLRRWSDRLPSSWLEMVRQGSSETFPQVIAKLLRGPMHELAINPTLILDRFADFFGKDSILLGSYSNVMDRDGDILEDFLKNVLGRTYPNDGAGPLRVNTSMDPETTELVRVLNALGSADPRQPPRFERALGLLEKTGDMRSDLELIHDRMRNGMKTLEINDNCAALRPVYEAINSKYGSHLINLEHGPHLFTRRVKKVVYANPDYLLQEGVVDAIRRVHRAAGGTPAG